MKRKVLVPISEGSEETEAVITIDILRRACAETTAASDKKTVVNSNCYRLRLNYVE